jgi:hypothetical protein
MTQCVRFPRFVSIIIIALLSGFNAPEVSGTNKSNIIIFLADELGYADIGVNGCKEIPTPHVDAIAKGGVRFTDGYAALRRRCRQGWICALEEVSAYLRNRNER